MFARPIQVAVAVVIAIGSVSTAAYASDASLVTTTPDQTVTTASDQNDLLPANRKEIAALSTTTSTSVVSADLHASVIANVLPKNVISELDVVLARTSSGAKFVASKLNALSYKWSTSQMSCLITLWSRESHWNFQSRNKRSGAYGIPQANPGTKMASAGSDWRVNPITQIKWGMSYVKSRYGSPCGALSKSNRFGWY
ncbi:hypothetical protein GALL_402850 [mine drainage metagenome]|uniref:Transglycosylase SLT domain-containing protein n=1 Tax=mine drainage metagenome TaxID=410659 RepID=A0A1J5Q3Z5_9ZZZZ